MKIPEQMTKPPMAEAIRNLHETLDPIGFVIFAGTTVMFILAITWGGSAYGWSSSVVIGLFCGSVALGAIFVLWVRRAGDKALIPPASIRHKAVSIGSVVMFLQGGCTQMIPYFLPFWFQATLGDKPITSAIHLLPSILSYIIALVTFGALGKH
jgi:hypothetical protein